MEISVLCETGLLSFLVWEIQSMKLKLPGMAWKLTDLVVNSESEEGGAGGRGEGTRRGRRGGRKWRRKNVEEEEEGEKVERQSCFSD